MTDEQVERIISNIRWATITIVLNIGVSTLTIVGCVGLLLQWKH